MKINQWNLIKYTIIYKNKVNKVALHNQTPFQELMLVLTDASPNLDNGALYSHLEVTRKDLVFIREYCYNTTVTSPSTKGRNSGSLKFKIKNQNKKCALPTVRVS